MFEDITGMITSSLFQQFIYLLYLVGAISIIGITIYLISMMWKRRKNQLDLSSGQREILSYGRSLVASMSLRNLYLKSPSGKTVFAGKIIALIFSEDNEGYLEKTIIGTRKTFTSAIDFYLIPFMSEHSEWRLDINLNVWNFVRTGDERFLIENTQKLNLDVKVKDPKKFSVDTLSTLQQAVQNGILSNAHHRIRIREKKLIKIPEEMSRMAR